MTKGLLRLTPPIDFRFLDLFIILVLSLGGFVGVALLLGIGGSILLPLEVASTVIPDATLNQAFGVEVIARGGRPGYRWEIGGLPEGLVSQSNGFISGTPRKHGIFKLKATVVDQLAATASREFDLRVVDYALVAPLRIRTTQLPPARVGSHYILALAVEGGVLPYQWTAGGIPAGLHVLDGVVEGTPASAGINTLDVTVIDSAAHKTNQKLDLQVVPSTLGADQKAPPPIGVLTKRMPSAVTGTPYMLQMAATGGRPPYQWQMVSSFPSTRLSLDGILETNNPSVWPDGAAFTFRVFDQDGNVAVATLSPTVVRPDTRLLASLAGVAAIGAWVLLLMLVRVAMVQRVGVGGGYQLATHHIGYIAVGFLLAATLTAIDGRGGTLVFAFVTAATATLILIGARRA